MDNNTKPSFFEDFMSRNASAARNPFEVRFASGDIFVFRPCQDYDEMVSVRTGARQFVKMALEAKVIDAWKPYLTKDITALSYVHFFAHHFVARYLMVPKEIVDEAGEKAVVMERVAQEPFGALHFLRMAKEWPHGFEAIRRAYDEQVGVDIEISEYQQVNEAKKESTPTPSTD